MFLSAAGFRLGAVAVLLTAVGAARAQVAAEPNLAETAANFAEAGPRPYRIWSREEYGGGPVVMSISQQPVSGFIYLGTGRGVSEYDGVRWHNIDPPDRSPTRGATVDRLGRIWTGCYNGVFLMRPDATGQLQLEPQAELLPPQLREIGYVRLIENLPPGVCFTARQNVIVIPPDGAPSAWRAEEPFNNTWWMHGALHNSITGRGTFRLDAGGRLTKLHDEAPVVFAAREVAGGAVLLLTAHGPRTWHGGVRRFETPAGYGDFFAGKGEVSAAAFLRDGRSVFTLESGDLGVFDPEGRVLLLWPKVPTLAFNFCRQFREDGEGGRWLA